MGHSVYIMCGSGILGFRPCWCSSPFPSPSISRCFLFTLLHLPLDLIRLFCYGGGICTPPNLLLIPDLGWHYGNWISKRDEIPSQVKSSIRLLCKCQRETNYILIIAVTDASMIYRELSKLTLYYFTKGKDPKDKLGGRFTH